MLKLSSGYVVKRKLYIYILFIKKPDPCYIFKKTLQQIWPPNDEFLVQRIDILIFI